MMTSEFLLSGDPQVDLGARGKGAEYTQCTDIVFAAEQGADIGEFSITYLAECSCDFRLFSQGEESILLDELAGFDCSDEMSVNCAAHKSPGPRDLIDRVPLYEHAGAFPTRCRSMWNGAAPAREV